MTRGRRNRNGYERFEGTEALSSSFARHRKKHTSLGISGSGLAALKGLQESRQLCKTLREDQEGI